MPNLRNKPSLVDRAYAAPLDVRAVLDLAIADARAAGHTGWANRLSDAKVAVDLFVSDVQSFVDDDASELSPSVSRLRKALAAVSP